MRVTPVSRSAGGVETAIEPLPLRPVVDTMVRLSGLAILGREAGERARATEANKDPEVDKPGLDT